MIGKGQGTLTQGWQRASESRRDAVGMGKAGRSHQCTLIRDVVKWAPWVGEAVRACYKVAKSTTGTFEAQLPLFFFDGLQLPLQRLFGGVVSPGLLCDQLLLLSATI